MEMITASRQEVDLTNVDRDERSQALLEGISYCPQTGKQVGKQDGQRFLLPGGQATWWHCPACGGWHVIVQKQ